MTLNKSIKTNLSISSSCYKHYLQKKGTLKGLLKVMLLTVNTKAVR